MPCPVGVAEVLGHKYTFPTSRIIRRASLARDWKQVREKNNGLGRRSTQIALRILKVKTWRIRLAVIMMENFFLIVPMDGNYIVRWNESTDLYQRISLPKRTEQFAFLGGGVVKDSVVLFPSMADYVLRIDRKSLEVTIDKILTQYISDIHTDKYVLLSHETGKKYCFL